MKTIQIKQYGDEDQLELVETPKPHAAAGQVLVRIYATSLNPIDVKLTSGSMKQMLPLHFPFVPGVDFSGVVESVGAGVRQFQISDEVWGYPSMGGTYAEYLAAPADKISHKPKTIGHVEAASLALVGQTALQAVDRAGVQKGQVVLIHGASGAVGSVAVQEAHRRGAKVIATAAAQSFDRLKQCGADELIDYQTSAFEKIVHNVDAVIDAVGGDTLQRSYGVLKDGGVLVSLVQPPSEQEAVKHHIKASMLVAESNSALLQKLAQLVDDGEIRPFVGEVYPLSDAANAWRENRAHHVDGKIVFRVASEAEHAKPGEAAASRRSATAS
jgi:NADPH:quinone reductase-like Zn-dependent oxidoreductase